MEKIYRFFGREREIEILKNSFIKKIVQEKEKIGYLVQGRKELGKTRLIIEFINTITSDQHLRNKMHNFSKNEHLIQFTCNKDIQKPYQVFKKIKDDIDKQQKVFRFIKDAFAILSDLVAVDSDKVEQFFDKYFRKKQDLFEKEIAQNKKEFEKYIKYLTKKSKNAPLIIFIQQVQWIDKDSLFLIEELLSNKSSFWGMIILEEDTIYEYNETIQKTLSNLINTGLMHSLKLRVFGSGFSVKLLKEQFGDNFFSEKEIEYLEDISEGCPGKLINFIESCIEEGWLYQDKNGLKYHKVDDFQELIYPEFRSLVDYIFEKWDNDGQIDKTESRDIFRRARAMKIPHNVTGDLINAVKDIGESRYRIIGKLIPGITSKISFITEDAKDKGRYIVEYIPGKFALNNTKNEFHKFNHENLWEAKEILISENGVLVVWKYSEGIRTRELNKVTQIENIKKTIDKLKQITKGLAELHHAGIIHGFIRPEAIIESSEGKYKLVTFDVNFLKYSQINDALIENNNLEYLSPEQLEGKKPDIRSDIFSLGVLFYNSITDKYPFIGRDKEKLLEDIKEGNISFNGRTLEYLPSNYKLIIEKCLAYDPDKRYQNADELLNDLMPLKNKIVESKTETKNIVPENIITEIKNFPRNTDIDHIRTYIKEKYNKNVDANFIKETKLQNTTKKISRKPILIISSLALIAFLILGFGNKIKPFFFGKKNTKIIHEFVYKVNTSGNLKSTSNSLNADIFSDILQTCFNQNSKKKLLTQNEFLKQTEKFKNFNVIPELFLTFNLQKPTDDYIIDLEISKNGKIVFSDSFTFLDETTFLESFMPHILKTVFDIEGKKNKDIHIPTKKWLAYYSFFEAKKEWNKLDRKAKQKVERALTIDPHFIQANLLLADIKRFFGNTDSALTIIDTISNKLTLLGYADSLRAVALTYRLKNHVWDAIAELKKLKEYYPMKKEISYKIAEDYFKLCENDEAIKNYTYALKLDPNYTLAINHLAYCYSQYGGFKTEISNNKTINYHEKAIKLFHKYVNIDSSANSYDSMGDGFLACGKLDSASWAKKRGLEIDPKVNYLYSSLSYINLRRGKFNEANKNIEDYIKNSGSVRQFIAKGYFLKALVSFNKKKYSEALQSCKQAKTIFDTTDFNTRNHELHWLLTQLYIKTGQLDSAKNELSAIKTFCKNKNIGPTNYHPIYKYKLHLEALLAEKDNNISKINDILNVFDNEIKYKIKDHGSPFGPAYFYTSFGTMLVRLSKYSNAETRLKTALEYNPNYALAHYQLWKLYPLLGKEEKSKKEYNIFVKLWENADSDVKTIYGL